MRSILIVSVLLTVATVTLCRRPVKKEEKFVIVVKGNDENSNATAEIKSTNTTTRLENISQDYKHDFKKINNTADEMRKMYKFEAKDGRIYRREKAVTEEVTQEPSYSNDQHVLSLPPSKERPIEDSVPENTFVYQANPYMAFKLCPVPLENYMPDTTTDQGNMHYVPHPYLYQAPPQTGYRVPKKLVVRYKPFIEMVDDTGADIGNMPYVEEPPTGPMTGNGFMVIYPNGMAKMVEPMNNGMADNYLQDEPTGFTSGGVYYHDGLKEYEFQMADNSNNKPEQDPQIYMFGPHQRFPENNQYGSVENSYNQNNAYDRYVPNQYIDNYNQEYAPVPTEQPWQQGNENLAANVNYEYNTGEVGNNQYLSPSENPISESTLVYTPSLHNVYGNANAAGYSVNNNHYYSNNQDNYKQYNYGAAANRNYQYADGQNGGTATNYFDNANISPQNVLYNHNLKTTTVTQQSIAEEVDHNRKYKQ